MNKLIHIILLLCGLFGRHRHITPPQKAEQQKQAGSWFTTPHFNDGYWVEYTWIQPEELSAAAGFTKGEWKPVTSNNPKSKYIFSQYRWEWKGIKKEDKTWLTEGFPGKPPDKPKSKEWIPSYDPFLPGTRYNL